MLFDNKIELSIFLKVKRCTRKRPPKRPNLNWISHYYNFGGSEEARTPYLIVANDALSQVSYRPK